MCKITIAICTRNRASLLHRTIQSLGHRTYDVNLFELLVIDNASKDNTAQVFETSRSGFLTAKYFLESEIGIAFARNRAMHEASGEILVYLDDDAISSTMWLETLVAPFENPMDDVKCVVGKVELEWEGSRPSWIPSTYETLYSKYDAGHRARLLKRGDYLLTTNVAFNREDLLRLGGFRTDLGHRDSQLLGGEDNEIFDRMISNGIQIWYEPKAVVFHWVPRERQTRRWLIKRVFWDGATQPLLDYGSGLGRKRYRQEMRHDLRRTLWITKERLLQDGFQIQPMELFLEWVRQIGRFWMNWRLARQ